jgi:hypothetical protein
MRDRPLMARRDSVLVLGNLSKSNGSSPLDWSG